ncbi:MAG: deoxyribose-phosphate aldolase [Bacillota bacterium]|nr:deoxyribose-phosphate aldolase [Bacillota bacterium]
MADYIDHTLLKPEATEADIIKLCREAIENRFYAVCINASYVKTAALELAGSDVKVSVVVGFPLGATTTAVKAFEAEEAVNNGADEIDMVIHIGALKSRNEQYVLSDISAVVKAANGKIVKVIIETGLLDDEEKILACNLAKEAGANFVKTSTGFGPGGATIADVQLMRETVGPGIGVKASGGVRTPEDARKMIEAGASRIGTSSGVKIAGQ